MSNTFHAQLEQALTAHRDPERAQGQQAYMKSEMPYFGLTAPVQQRICRELIRANPFPTAEDWRESVLTVWRNATHREYRYCAIQLAETPTERDWLNLDAFPMLEEMVVDGAWWDYVDALATRHFGLLLRNHPTEMKTLLRRWATDEHIWRRRVAILAQLKFKDQTDEGLLQDAILPSMEETEFFLRKGIGWALRQYSRTSPEFVIGFVDRYADRLSGLSKREALRVLIKQGVVDTIP